MLQCLDVCIFAVLHGKYTLVFGFFNRRNNLAEKKFIEPWFHFWEYIAEIYHFVFNEANSFDMFWCRNASDCNEHHDVEITSARVAAEQDVASNSEDLLQHVNSKILKANFLRFR